MREITFNEWDEAVRRVVAAHPDNVNPRDGDTEMCQYFDGECSCLIGHVLINEFGVPYSPEWEGKGAGLVLELLNKQGNYYFNPRVTVAANNLQSYADEMYNDDTATLDGYTYTTWSEALSMYDND